MRFTVKTAGNHYDEEDAQKLQKLGFKFSPTENEYDKSYGAFTKDDNTHGTVEIGTLEELLAFISDYDLTYMLDARIIVERNKYEEDLGTDYVITIYDWYLE